MTRRPKPIVMGKFCPVFTALIFVLVQALGAHGQEDQLILLSPHWEGVRYEFQWAFEEYYKKAHGREISITWLDVGGTSEILRFISSEFSRRPNGIGVDIFFGGGVEPYADLKREGVLEPYKLPDATLSAIPPSIAGTPLYDSAYTWYAPVIGTFGILCNEEVLKLLKLKTPGQWKDLTAPEYHSWVSSSDPRKSGSSHMIYEILLQAYGWDEGLSIILRLARNIRTFGAASNLPAKDVEAGETACAFAYDSQAWFSQAQHGKDKISFTLPGGLTVLAPDGAGILKGAPHMAVAKEFMQFLFSMEAQRLWIRPPKTPGGPREFSLARLPVLEEPYREAAPRLSDFNPFLWNNSFRYDSAKASLRWNILNDLLGVYAIDPHPLLRTLDEFAPLASFPKEEEVLKLAGAEWQDPVARDGVMREWRGRALAPYRGSKGLELMLTALPWIAGLIVFLWIGVRRRSRMRELERLSKQ